MLIDPIAIHYSGLVASTTVVGPDQTKFILAFKGLLVSVGWTVIDAISATGTFTLPLGAPASSGVTVLPKRVVSCSGGIGFLSIGTYYFTLYDPFSEVPAINPACIMVPLDVTPFGTVINLASFISSVTPFNAAAVNLGGPGSFQINLTAKIGGPEANFQVLDGAGGYVESGGNLTGGGGYQLQSATGASIYQVAMTGHNSGGGDNSLEGNLVFDFTLNGGPVQYRLLDGGQGTRGNMGILGVGGVGAYTIVANPHGFAVFDAPHDPTTKLLRKISLFAMAPYIPGEEVPPTEVFDPAYAVFVVGPNAIGGNPAWSGNSAASLDGPPYTNNANNPWPRLLALRSPGPALLTPAGVPLTLGAYVMFGPSPADGSPAYVVGKLWDCALVSDALDAGAIIDSKQFLTLGYSDGSNNTTRCTLMMASGQAIIPDPINPSPPPPPLVWAGVVNIFGSGVTRISGTVFRFIPAGSPITINGQAYFVASVTDDDHLDLTTNGEINSNVPYTIP